MRPVQDNVVEAVSLEWREISLADGDILQAFVHLRKQAFPWLLDSALNEHGLGRFSFAGSDPYAVVRITDQTIEEHCRREARVGSKVGHRVFNSDPMDWIRDRIRPFPDLGTDLPVEFPFLGGAVGYLGYEFCEDSRPGRTVDRGAESGPADFAEATLLFVDRVLAFDHQASRAFVLGIGFDSILSTAQRRAEHAVDEMFALLEGRITAQVPPASCDELTSKDRVDVLSTQAPSRLDLQLDEREYRRRVITIKEEILAGNVYEANLTNRMTMPFEGDPWALYGSLRRLSPAPFACFMEVPDGVIVGSSPERFLRLSAQGEVESRPIKGTRSRGLTAEQDDLLKQDLVSSEKDRAENLMIVDLVRNDLGRVCKIGSIRVPNLMGVEKYASVFQLVSTVTGRIREDMDSVDLIEAAFPPGSMTGAPKIAAVSLLKTLEPSRRGVYSGALGYFDLRGGLDLCVVIRTILIQKERAWIQVGGAIVADSDPAAEYAETLDKARALWAALLESDREFNDESKDE